MKSKHFSDEFRPSKPDELREGELGRSSSSFDSSDTPKSSDSNFEDFLDDRLSENEISIETFEQLVVGK